MASPQQSSDDEMAPELVAGPDSRAVAMAKAYADTFADNFTEDLIVALRNAADAIAVEFAARHANIIVQKIIDEMNRQQMRAAAKARRQSEIQKQVDDGDSEKAYRIQKYQVTTDDFAIAKDQKEEFDEAGVEATKKLERKKKMKNFLKLGFRKRQ